VVSGGAVVTSGDPPGEVWIGEGKIGGDDWAWKRAAGGRKGRVGGLAATADALAWAETQKGADLSSLVLALGGEPEVVVPETALFDGAVGLAGKPGRALCAAPVPPDDDSAGGLQIVLRSR
jgi:hypothetical protein